jgi:hypothetical protein
MSMHQPWLAIYRNFDDDALAALASIGLLRRAAKDVEAGKLAWDGAPGAAHGVVRADGQLVRIGETGPAHARCDCPAPGICKHILAAALWLRDVPQAAGDSAADALTEVLALDPAAVFKAAGVAATRKAAALFVGAGPALLRAQGGVLVIELPEFDLTCRYVAGAGFGGMVSEAPPASRAAMHLLAIATAWRARERQFTWPEAAAAPAADAATGLSAADREFLERLRQVLLEICGTGWSHVSDVMPAQLRALGMSARVESFPRLSGLLRTLAGTAELLAKRDFSSDERQAIKLAVRIHALCHALEHADGAALEDLRGRARRTFDGDATLELLPLGAHWWEQRSGARGLTISFWDHAGKSVLQVVLARRDANDPGFSRAAAWSSLALWPGAGAAAMLADGALVLQQARMSADGRIGIGGETRARPDAPWRADDQRWMAAGFDDWRALAAAVRSGAGLRGEGVECVLLRPSSLESPRLDEIHQLLRWTVRDLNGMPLVLRLPCETWHRTRIENLEAWAASGHAIKGVVARLERGMHGAMLEPLTIIVDSNGILHSVALDYLAPAAAKASSFASRIARMFTAKREYTEAARADSHLEWTDALLGIMQHKAMTGRLHLLGEEKAELAAIREWLRATGLDTVADAVDRYIAAPGAAGALTLLHLAQTCAELDTSFIYR